MFEPPRISPEAASERSFSAAARPLPRSSSVKHFDCDTNTLMSASGESRLYCSHHLFSGSVTASVPIFLSQVGICGGGGSAAEASAVAPSAVSVSEVRNGTLSLVDAMSVISPRFSCARWPARRAAIPYGRSLGRSGFAGVLPHGAAAARGRTAARRSGALGRLSVYDLSLSPP